MNKDREEDLIIELKEWFKDNRDKFNNQQNFFNQNKVGKLLKDELSGLGLWQKRRKINKGLDIKEKKENIELISEKVGINHTYKPKPSPYDLQCQTCAREKFPEGNLFVCKNKQCKEYDNGDW